MTVDSVWYLSAEASQRAEQAYQRLTDVYAGFMDLVRTDRVSRSRFLTLARRVTETGAPFGAHTLVHRGTEELLLVRHDGVDRWVLPGGEVDRSESFRAAAERELAEEAGIEARYDGLAMAIRVEIEYREYDTWGVLPVFAARPTTTTLEVDDPDGEISRAAWFAFENLPSDTRDREDLLAWRDRVSP